MEGIVPSTAHYLRVVAHTSKARATVPSMVGSGRTLLGFFYMGKESFQYRRALVGSVVTAQRRFVQPGGDCTGEALQPVLHADEAGDPGGGESEATVGSDHRTDLQKNAHVELIIDGEFGAYVENEGHGKGTAEPTGEVN